jgi:hypothetical protein
VAAAYDLIDGYVYISNDSGLTWAPYGNKEFWGTVACDSTCTNVVLTLPGSAKFYHSSDGGVTYSSSNMVGGVANPAPVAGSSDGTKWVVVTDSATYGYIYTSTDNGTSFTKETNNPDHWHAVASSSDGTKLVAGHGGIGTGQISTSNDSGITWTTQANSTNADWASLACDSTCTKIVAAAYNDYIYTSNDSGVTWTPQTNSSKMSWASVACDSNCTKIVAAVYNGYIYTSNDSGVTWVHRL